MHNVDGNIDGEREDRLDMLNSRNNTVSKNTVPVMPIALTYDPLEKVQDAKLQDGTTADSI